MLSYASQSYTKGKYIPVRRGEYYGVGDAGDEEAGEIYMDAIHEAYEIPAFKGKPKPLPKKPRKKFHIIDVQPEYADLHWGDPDPAADAYYNRLYKQDYEDVISPGIEKLKKKLQKMNKGDRNWPGVTVEDDGLYPIQQDDY